jgi:hypothetical protein
MLNCADIFTPHATSPDPVVAALDDTICYALSPVVGFLSLVLIFLSFVVALSFHDGSPTSMGATSRAHSRVEMATLAVNTIASIAAALILPGPAKSTMVLLIWQGFMFLSHVYLALLLIWFQPYYNSSILKLKTGINMVVAWTAATEVARRVIEETYGNPSVSSVAVHTATLVAGNTTIAATTTTSDVDAWKQIFLAFETLVICACGWLMFPLAQFLIDTRIRQVQKLSFAVCRNVYEFELKMRVELQPVTLFLQTHWDKIGGTLSGNCLKALTDEHQTKIGEMAEVHT